LPFFNQAGFIILMVDASSVMRMIRLIMVLLRFFGKEFTAPRYAAPANARVLPVGDKGDPILAVAKIFSTDITAVAVEWSLPTAQMTPDPGFQDVVANTAAEFIPPCFLVEKSEIDPMSAEIDIGTAASEPDSVGIVTHQRETGFESGGKLVKRKERVRDMYGDIVVKFQRYYMVSPTQTPETFWTGQLGKFRWIDSEVEKDKTYYYRVRAFSGSLFWDKNQHILFFPATLSYTPTNPSGFTWPADDSSDPPVMGKPTGIFSVRIPKIPANFDVLENLKRLFQTAFSLDFHLAPIIKKTGPDTNPTVVRPVFNDNGDPVYPTLPEDIGRGSLENWAGPLATFDALPLVGIVSSATTMSEQYKPSDVTGRYPDMPWQKFIVRYNSTRMANLVASAMLQAGSYAIEGFREIMQGPLPMGPVVFGVMSGKTTLEQCVFALTDIIPDDPEHPSRGSSIDLPQASTYGSVYSDETFRKNVLVAINQIKNFTLGGVKPDWQSLALLRDIVPWAGQILYQILAAIQSLLDAFNGVIQEIKDFIDLLLRKINALERFIEFLIRLMEYVLSLDVSCYVLNVSPITNGIPELIEAIDNAGNAPPMDPGGYSAGIALAYVAPDISAFQKAFGLIF
jgi:hypothetical protein